MTIHLLEHTEHHHWPRRTIDHTACGLAIRRPLLPHDGRHIVGNILLVDCAQCRDYHDNPDPVSVAYEELNRWAADCPPTTKGPPMTVHYTTDDKGNVACYRRIIGAFDPAQRTSADIGNVDCVQCLDAFHVAGQLGYPVEERHLRLWLIDALRASGAGPTGSIWAVSHRLAGKLIDRWDIRHPAGSIECPRCHGRGIIVDDTTMITVGCPRCHGTVCVPAPVGHRPIHLSSYIEPTGSYAKVLERSRRGFVTTAQAQEKLDMPNYMNPDEVQPGRRVRVTSPDEGGGWDYDIKARDGDSAWGLGVESTNDRITIDVPSNHFIDLGPTPEPVRYCPAMAAWFPARATWRFGPLAACWTGQLANVALHADGSITRTLADGTTTVMPAP